MCIGKTNAFDISDIPLLYLEGKQHVVRLDVASQGLSRSRESCFC